MEKPATPETVLEQVVSGLNDEDMAAIGEQFILSLCASPALPGPSAGHTGPSSVALHLLTGSSLIVPLSELQRRWTSLCAPSLFGQAGHALHQMAVALSAKPRGTQHCFVGSRLGSAPCS